MKRRNFLGVLAAAAVARPPALRAQQAVPVIAYLATTSASAPSFQLEAFLRFLQQAGFEIGRAARIEYFFAENQPERLPALAAEAVKLGPAVIVAAGGPAAALAAKAATSTIPIVFAPIPDPVRSGIVTSMNRPGGNITGVAAFTIELDPKRLELLHELVPAQGRLGVLINPSRPDTKQQVDGITAAAQAVSRELAFAGARTVQEFEGAFNLLAQGGIVALLVAADPFFVSQRAQIVALANRQRWPAMYQWREFVDAGGFASYGPSLSDSYRQVALFVARILKGEKPGDLPVQQPTRFEFVINLKTARTLGSTVPLTMLGRADEVVE